MSPSKAQKEQVFDKEEAIVMSSVELSNEHDDNQAAFYAKYTNKKIEMTGAIDNIGEHYITFDGKFGSRVDCSPSDMNSFLKFRKGDRITVVGRMKKGLFNPELQSCKLKASMPDSKKKI